MRVEEGQGSVGVTDVEVVDEHKKNAHLSEVTSDKSLRWISRFFCFFRLEQGFEEVKMMGTSRLWLVFSVGKGFLKK